MSTPESIAEAFGRGLMQGMIGQTQAPAQQPPMVIPTDAVRQAVSDFLQPHLEAEEAPTPQQLDLDFPQGIEDAPSDPIAEMTLRRVQEARERKEAMDNPEEVPEGMYLPDDPRSGQPWLAPR